MGSNYPCEMERAPPFSILDMTSKFDQNDDIENPIIIGQITGHFGVKGWLKIRSFTRPLDEVLSYSEWWVKSEPHSKHGSKSGVGFSSNSDSTPGFAASSGYDSKAKWSSFKVTHSTAQSKKIVAKLDGVDSREQAEALIGCHIVIFDTQLAPLAEGEYYWRQLLGLSVSNLEGDVLGIVEDVVETGANDVLVVKSNASGKTVDETSADLLAEPQKSVKARFDEGQGDEKQGETRLIPWIHRVIVKVDLSQSELVVDWGFDF